MPSYTKLLIFTIFLFVVSLQVHAQPGLNVTPNNTVIGLYKVFELSVNHSQSQYTNVWEEVQITTEFISPSGRKILVGGFYHSQNMWKVRFAPSELGSYIWSLTLKNASGSQAANGSFGCTASNEKGFVRKHPKNPRRLVFEDGSLYNALGIARGLSTQSGPSGNPRVYLQMDSLANLGGLNIVRWSVTNGFYKLWQTISPSGNVYLMKEGSWADTVFIKNRELGFRIFMDFFGWKPPYAKSWTDSEMDALKRYVKYIVDRYGAYVDFWELMNEMEADYYWYAIVSDYVRSIDPYQHLISTSWQRPDHPLIDIISPHAYSNHPELEVDLGVVPGIQKYYKHEKLIMYGEAGNSGQSWDPLSALRARIKSWTAFFMEAVLMYWYQADKTYKNRSANLYIGPEERQYFSVLQEFTVDVEPDVEKAQTCSVSSSTEVRHYELRSSRSIYVYLINGESITDITQDVSVSFDIPFRGTATWHDTKTGQVTGQSQVEPGRNTIKAPGFQTDIALRIRIPTIPIGYPTGFTSRETVMVPSGGDFNYTVTYVSPKFEQVQLEYLKRPSWVKGDLIHLFGVFPQNKTDDTVIVQLKVDGIAYDTLVVVAGPDKSPPSVPGNFKIPIKLSNAIYLNWEASTDNETGVHHYHVYRNGNTIATVATVSYRDTLFEQGKC